MLDIKKVRLGKTDLWVTKTAMGCLPVQRVDRAAAKKLLRRAYDSGINYFDTANKYTDSEEKIGEALHDVRHDIVISTKTDAQDAQGVLAHIEKSLRSLRTDYIDLIQFHNPAAVPDKNDPKSAYAGALEAKKKGYIRHIGITNHRLAVANQAIASGDFETLQFPFSYLSSQEDIELTKRCKEADMGFIAMKGLSGGMLNNAAACYAFMQGFDNVVPIWGIQYEWELDQWLELTERNQQMTEELQAVIEKDRKELAMNFCRSCGYCMPCTVNINIPRAARMAMLLRRSPYKPFMTKEIYEEMHRIDNCVRCNACKSRCPYGLETPDLLVAMLKDYDEFYAKHHND